MSPVVNGGVLAVLRESENIGGKCGQMSTKPAFRYRKVSLEKLSTGEAREGQITTHKHGYAFLLFLLPSSSQSIDISPVPVCSVKNHSQINHGSISEQTKKGAFADWSLTRAHYCRSEIPILLLEGHRLSTQPSTERTPMTHEKHAPHTAKEVANWFLAWTEDEGIVITEQKMHALLYYAQGHHLANTGEPLFSDEIVAGEAGPYIPTLTFDSQPEVSEGES
jgi:hypothetical protein